MGTPTDKIDTLFEFMKYDDKVESYLSVLAPRKSSRNLDTICILTYTHNILYRNETRKQLPFASSTYKHGLRHVWLF